MNVFFKKGSVVFKSPRFQRNDAYSLSWRITIYHEHRSRCGLPAAVWKGLKRYKPSTHCVFSCLLEDCKPNLIRSYQNTSREAAEKFLLEFRASPDVFVLCKHILGMPCLAFCRAVVAECSSLPFPKIIRMPKTSNSTQHSQFANLSASSLAVSPVSFSRICRSTFYNTFCLAPEHSSWLVLCVSSFYRAWPLLSSAGGWTI